MTLDVLEQQNLQAQLAKAIFDVLAGTDFERAECIWVLVGYEGFSIREAWTSSGDLIRPGRTNDFELVGQLKRAMADPDKGSWSSTQLFLSSSGAYHFTFNYDRRVYREEDPFQQPASEPYSPDDEAWHDEFRLFPRKPQYLPDWVEHLHVKDPAEPDRILLQALNTQVEPPAELAGLVRQPGCSRIWQQISDTLSEHLGDDFNKPLLADYRDGDRAYEGFWQEICQAVIQAADIEEDPADRSMHSPQLETELATVAATNPAAAYDDVLERTLIELIEHQIHQRLDME